MYKNYTKFKQKSRDFVASLAIKYFDFMSPGHKLLFFISVTDLCNELNE